eukprot:scaffold10301_cov121-Isochrysis_galbana.AAC.8
MENDKMIVCEGPSGCKKYLPNLALDLKVPRCICHTATSSPPSSAQDENAAKSKVARKTAATLAKTHGISTLHALLSANKAGTCPRFAAGLCPNNKKGDSCTGDHNLEGAWVDTPDGKRACTIPCKLPPHSKQDPGRLPQRQKLRLPPPSMPCTLPEHSPLHPHTPIYSPMFTPTLGYPGEGPTKIATYNINGAKEKLFRHLQKSAVVDSSCQCSTVFEFSEPFG